MKADINDLNEFRVHIYGNGMKLEISVLEEDDLTIIETILRKIKLKVEENRRLDVIERAVQQQVNEK